MKMLHEEIDERSPDLLTHIRRDVVVDVPEFILRKRQALPSSRGARRRVVGGRGVPLVKNPVGPNLLCGLRAGRIDSAKDESIESEQVIPGLVAAGTRSYLTGH
jgi:hypothetical protein